MIFNSQTQVRANNVNEEVSVEAEALILEAAIADLGDDVLESFLGDTTEVRHAVEDNIVLERTIVKLDKAAKLAKAEKMAIFTIAREKNDPKFKKLLTVWKWERFLEEFLTKRYGAEGKRRAKKVMQKNSNSKSKTVKTAVTKAKRMMNSGVKGPLRPPSEPIKRA